MTSLAASFPRSIVVEGAIRLPVSADKAWSYVGDVGNADIAKGLVDRVEVKGSGVGAVRALHLPGGGAVIERVEEYNDTDRHYVYQVIDSGPINLTNHLGLTKVQPAGADACIVSWISTGQPIDGHAEELRTILRGNIDLVFAAIKRHFNVV